MNTPLFGMTWAVIVLLIIWWARHMNGRLWLALGLVSLGMFWIGFARADSVPAALGLRIDQALDLIVCGFSMACLIRIQTQARSV
ncbi:MAG: hypothetical protein IH587_05530 [Anaerolineae bacterium]|nr:hypothetical protein [Anaerolineae bacterium]